MLFNQDILSYIQNFTDIKNMLDTTKKYNSIKDNIYLWKLNKEYSIKYLDNINQFRTLIHNHKNIHKLSFSGEYDVNFSLNYYINFNELNDEQCNILENVRVLDLSFCNYITDVSMFKNVHTLNLSFCNYITDISMLKSAHTLNLSHCYDITDVSDYDMNMMIEIK